jgi:hypothetical protein
MDTELQERRSLNENKDGKENHQQHKGTILTRFVASDCVDIVLKVRM